MRCGGVLLKSNIIIHNFCSFFMFNFLYVAINMFINSSFVHLSLVWVTAVMKLESFTLTVTQPATSIVLTFIHATLCIAWSSLL